MPAKTKRAIRTDVMVVMAKFFKQYRLHNRRRSFSSLSARTCPWASVARLSPISPGLVPSEHERMHGTHDQHIAFSGPSPLNGGCAASGDAQRNTNKRRFAPREIS